MTNEEFLEAVYESMTGALLPKYRIPGVEDAYMEGGKCDRLYSRVYDAARRLEARLGLQEEDEDVDEIIQCMMAIQEELCYRMYGYGAKFGMKE